eukprot:1158626-Pyramimonas_sp.AAC.1
MPGGAADADAHAQLCAAVHGGDGRHGLRQPAGGGQGGGRPAPAAQPLLRYHVQPLVPPG